jgi:hypothetical protein
MNIEHALLAPRRSALTFWRCPTAVSGCGPPVHVLVQQQRRQHGSQPPPGETTDIRTRCVRGSLASVLGTGGWPVQLAALLAREINQPCRRSSCESAQEREKRLQAEEGSRLLTIMYPSLDFRPVGPAP